ncbi:MAG: GspH/FimT family protein [Burkholderiales bacterium]|jgi:type IV fimbrial biogenesis protein FimT|nr:GspH/FimT family protein [Burkholderiales bacterium]
MNYLRTKISGFTLVEVMVTATIFAIIAALAIPTISEWTGKSKVRADAEALQNGIRFAKNTALKRNQPVEFSLVNSTTAPVVNSVAVDDGAAWVVRDVPRFTETATVLQVGAFSQGGIQPKGNDNKTLVFGGLGQVYTDIPNGSALGPFLLTTRAYRVASSEDKYPLCVLVKPSGRTKLCDPYIMAGDRSCPGSATQSCL